MDSQQIKFDRFSKAVITDINKKVQVIVCEAEKNHQQAVDDIAVKGEEFKADKIQKGKKQILEKYVREISSASLNSNKEVLLYRAELCNELFDNIINRLENYTNSNNYVVFLQNEIEKVFEKADKTEKVEVLLKEKDLVLFEELVEKCSLKNAVSKIDNSIKIGGVKILFTKKNIIDDRTLDLALDLERERFNQSSKLEI